MCINTDNFVSFPIWVPFIYLFVSFLIALARTSSTMWNKSDESEHPCFYSWSLRKRAIFHHWVAVGLSSMAFIALRYIPFIYPNLFLSWKAVVFCQMLFLYLLIWSNDFYSLLMWWITLINLHMLNYPCIFGMNPSQSWCIIF